MTDNQKIEKKLNLIYKYGGIDGGHHKQWLIDQIVRVLLNSEKKYVEWVKTYCEGADGANTYEWDEGIAP